MMPSEMRRGRDAGATAWGNTHPPQARGVPPERRRPTLRPPRRPPRALVGLSLQARRCRAAEGSRAAAPRLAQRGAAPRQGGERWPRAGRRSAGAEAATPVVAPTAPTFAAAALAWYAGKRWRSAKHSDQVLSSLRRYAFPTLGALPVDLITRARRRRRRSSRSGARRARRRAALYRPSCGTLNNSLIRGRRWRQEVRWAPRGGLP